MLRHSHAHYCSNKPTSNVSEGVSKVCLEQTSASLYKSTFLCSVEILSVVQQNDRMFLNRFADIWSYSDGISSVACLSLVF